MSDHLRTKYLLWEKKNLIEAILNLHNQIDALRLEDARLRAENEKLNAALNENREALAIEFEKDSAVYKAVKARAEAAEAAFCEKRGEVWKLTDELGREQEKVLSLTKERDEAWRTANEQRKGAESAENKALALADRVAYLEGFHVECEKLKAKLSEMGGISEHCEGCEDHARFAQMEAVVEAGKEWAATRPNIDDMETDNLYAALSRLSPVIPTGSASEGKPCGGCGGQRVVSAPCPEKRPKNQQCAALHQQPCPKCCPPSPGKEGEC